MKPKYICYYLILFILIFSSPAHAHAGLDALFMMIALLLYAPLAVLIITFTSDYLFYGRARPQRIAFYVVCAAVLMIVYHFMPGTESSLFIRYLAAIVTVAIILYEKFFRIKTEKSIKHSLIVSAKSYGIGVVLSFSGIYLTNTFYYGPLMQQYRKHVQEIESKRKADIQTKVEQLHARLDTPQTDTIQIHRTLVYDYKSPHNPYREKSKNILYTHHVEILATPNASDSELIRAIDEISDLTVNKRNTPDIVHLLCALVQDPKRSPTVRSAALHELLRKYIHPGSWIGSAERRQQYSEFLGWLENIITDPTNPINANQIQFYTARISTTLALLEPSSTFLRYHGNSLGDPSEVKDILHAMQLKIDANYKN